MKTKQVPFDIYIPATEHRAAVKADTILIDVYTDDFGNEMVTTASTELIQKTQARYMGLLAGLDIRALRERLGYSQDQLSDLLGCGKKSLSRWENGREYPSQLVNTLLRLLEEKKVTPEDLRSVRQPRMAMTSNFSPTPTSSAASTPPCVTYSAATQTSSPNGAPPSALIGRMEVARKKRLRKPR